MTRNTNYGKAILPIPQDVKLNVPKHNLGTPKTIWTYKDQSDNDLFYVCRFISDNGDKQDRPLSYRKYNNGSCRFVWKGLDKPRPLYGLQKLASDPDAKILICEGEKAADAAQLIFPEYITMTSPNGTGSPHCADWKPLEGREIIIWPDNDAEGGKYARAVSRLCLKITKTVSIVNVPDDFPEKWDLADELPDGVTKEDLFKLIETSERVYDVLENLVERCKNDAGLPFNEDILEALAILKKENFSQFENLRHNLKKAGIRVGELDKAIQQDTATVSEPEPDQLDLANVVIDAIGAENILATPSHVWIWNEKGFWHPIEDRVLKATVQDVLKSSIAIYNGEINSVTEILKNAIQAPEHEWNTNTCAINLQNGELHWSGSEWLLEPHNREHYRTTQIPVIYDPDAKCPRFEKFLDEIFAPDDDAKEKSQSLLEMMGYSLMCHADYEKFIILIGSGANGKSVFLSVLEALIGKENTAAVQPSKLADKFQRVFLHLKLINLVTEIAEGDLIADAELKAITSGEVTTVENKFERAFNFKPYCTCWFGTNHMPHTRDFSEALFRRALVIPFDLPPIK